MLSTYPRMLRAMRREELGPLVARLRAVEATGTVPSAAERQRLGAVVMTVLRVLPTDSRCLVRSLVLLAMLARRGIHSTLVIGVRTEPEFAAHAWVEFEDEPLLPTGNGEFTPLTVV